MGKYRLLQLSALCTVGEDGCSIVTSLQARELAKSPQKLGKNGGMMVIVEMFGDNGSSAVPTDEACMRTADENGEGKDAVLLSKLRGSVRQDTFLGALAIFAADVVEEQVCITIVGDESVC